MLSLVGKPSLRVVVRGLIEHSHGCRSTKPSSITLKKEILRSFQTTARPTGSAGLARSPVQDDIIGIPYTAVRPALSQPEFHHAPPKPSLIPRRDGSDQVANFDIGEEFIIKQSYAPVPAYFRGSGFDRVPYWQQIGRWQDVTENQFLSYRWGVSGHGLR
jgi:hypothetical protein